jgi:hypothetical protein
LRKQESFSKNQKETFSVAERDKMLKSFMGVLLATQQKLPKELEAMNEPEMGVCKGVPREELERSREDLRGSRRLSRTPGHIPRASGKVTPGFTSLDLSKAMICKLAALFLRFSLFLLTL